LALSQGEVLCRLLRYELVVVGGGGLEGYKVSAVGEDFGLEEDGFAGFPVGEIALVGGAAD
jgi:hypothetical protein